MRSLSPTTLAAIVNGALLVNAAHGAIAAAAALFSPLAALSGPLGLLSLVAQSALVLLVTLYPVFPKRVFVPYFLALTWVGFLLLPVPVLVPHLQVLMLLMGVVEIGASAGVVGWHVAARGRVLFDEADFAEARVSWRYAVGFHLVIAIVFVVGTPIFLFGNLSLAIHRLTGGFAVLYPSRLEMAERTYQRDGRTVILTATIHVAEPAYYDALFSSFPNRDHTLLLEGVTDAEGLVKAPRYEQAATLFGLEVQGAPAPGQRTAPGVSDLRRSADVDVGDFSATTRELLEAVALAFEGDWAAYLQAFRRFEGHETELIATLRHDLLELRNERVLGAVDEALTVEPPTIPVLPWGAAHMPGLERGLLSRGFREVSESRRTAIRWLGE